MFQSHFQGTKYITGIPCSGFRVNLHPGQGHRSNSVTPKVRKRGTEDQSVNMPKYNGKTVSHYSSICNLQSNAKGARIYYLQVKDNNK